MTGFLASRPNYYYVTAHDMLVLLVHVSGHLFNPYKPSVLFVRHSQTVQTQIRRRSMRRLISVSTACLQNVIIKFEYK